MSRCYCLVEILQGVKERLIACSIYRYLVTPTLSLKVRLQVPFNFVDLSGGGLVLHIS
jgi:hypothetical protein